MRNERFDDLHIALGIADPQGKRNYDQETEESVSAEIKGLSPDIHTVIISSEHFQSRCVYLDELEKLKDYFARFFSEIEVVVYLRPQVDMATSLYSTLLKGNFKKEFKPYIFESCVPGNYYYDYSALLKNWASVFGKSSIRPRIFEVTKLKSGNLIEDFLDFVKLSSDGFKMGENLNESINGVGQELLRLSNEFKENFNDFPKIYYLFKSYVEKNFIGNGQSLPFADAMRIQDKFSTINNLVAREWFQSDQLFTVDYERKYQNGRELSEEETKIIRRLFDMQLHLLPAVAHEAFNNQSKMIERYEIDAIRDAAIAMEKRDLNAALTLMSVALRFRPSGEFLKKKIAEYTASLEKKA